MASIQKEKNFITISSKEALEDVEPFIDINDNCEWDIIQDICKKAITRKNVTENQIREASERLLKEIRSENIYEEEAAGEEFKQALGLSDEDVYKVIKDCSKYK